MPETFCLLPLPPQSPELNPVENVRQFLRQNKLSNRIFDGYEAIVTAACEAWNSGNYGLDFARRLAENVPTGRRRAGER